MGNSHQSGKNKRLGTYCTMTGCVKYPPEAHSHESEMRPVIRVVHFPPTLASSTGTGRSRVGEELKLTRVLLLPNEFKIPRAHRLCLPCLKHAK